MVKGKLHSVDLADSILLPKDEGPGWLVPEWLRSPWTIYLGDSRELPPKVLAQVGQLPIFIHDSLHPCEHMIWEYRKGLSVLTARRPAFLR